MNTARLFFDRFVEKVNSIDISVYKSGGSNFTQKVISSINEIIESMEFRSENEYYRIDAIGWSQRNQEISDSAAKLGINAHLWDLKIAVEHENDKNDWTDELIKLAHIRCPLKVIIGYNECNNRDDGDLKKLNGAAQWMRMLEAFDPSANETYLAIFGNAYAKGCPYSTFDYRGYIYDYDKAQFKQL